MIIWCGYNFDLPCVFLGIKHQFLMNRHHSGTYFIDLGYYSIAIVLGDFML